MSICNPRLLPVVVPVILVKIGMHPLARGEGRQSHLWWPCYTAQSLGLVCRTGMVIYCYALPITVWFLYYRKHVLQNGYFRKGNT